MNSKKYNSLGSLIIYYVIYKNTHIKDFLLFIRQKLDPKKASGQASQENPDGEKSMSSQGNIDKDKKVVKDIKKVDPKNPNAKVMPQCAVDTISPRTKLNVKTGLEPVLKGKLGKFLVGEF